MYLKKINLRGFKSFKNKSELTFEHGISVIVGPNGSGKSNITDAISWVLGVQSPKILRGKSMDDVIFRNKQEELGIAEVSLIFNNRNKLIPIEFNEVRFTRRGYMQGGSEYFINSSPSRLHDIQDLISATGIGKGLYTIISQGQIDEIAMLKPVERKVIIDELIGISRYKVRKKKSENNLVRVENDISRVNDLIIEIKRTLNPLKSEAEKAEKFASISGELKKIEMSLFIHDFEALNAKWDSLKTRTGKISDDKDRIKKDLDNYNKQKARIQDKSISKNREYEIWFNRLNDMKSYESELRRINDIVKNKRFIFDTLANMFDRELKIKEAGDRRDNQIIKKDRDLSSAIKSKLEVITGKLGNMIDEINKINAGDSLLQKLRQQEDDIKKEVSDLINTVDEYFENTKEGKYAESDGKDEKLKHNKPDNRDLINNARNGCNRNMERVKSLLNILKLLMEKYDVSLNICREKYLQYKSSIEEENGKIGRINIDIGKLQELNNRNENELYRMDVEKDRIKDRVKDITNIIIEKYNEHVEYIFKNYKQAENVGEARIRASSLRNEIRRYKNVNPNASYEYKRLKKRYDFLIKQKDDLTESKKGLEELILEIDKNIKDMFVEKFEEINKNFRYYFKLLFPLGEGEMQLNRNGSGKSDEFEVELKVDIGNSKYIQISLLSGGEKTLVAIAFLFSIFATNKSPFYIFDEIDAALDDANLRRFLILVKNFSKNQQIIMITHQKRTMEIADVIYGITMQSDGISKVVSEKIKERI